MTSIIPKPFWFVPLATLALLGAGCFSSAPETPPMPETPTKPVAPAPSAPAPTPSESAPPEPSSPVSSGYELPDIDDSWRTYSNAALGFSFRYPTTGRYAPEWEMFIVREGDVRMKEGCFFNEQTDPGTEKRMTIHDREFCRTLAIDPAAGSRYYTYHYSTKFGSSYAIISFTKRAVVGDNYEDPACRGKIVFPFPGCVEFDEGYFEAHLDQVMRTFVEDE